MQNLELGSLVERVRSAVVAHAGALQAARGDPDAAPPYIVLDLPCTFFMLRTHTRVPSHRCLPSHSHPSGLPAGPVHCLGLHAGAQEP